MTYVPALKAYFGVRRSDAQALAMLFDAGGAVVPTAALCVLPSHDKRAVCRTVYRLRAALDVGTIINVQRAGYRLSEKGLAKCRRALADAGQAKAA